MNPFNSINFFEVSNLPLEESIKDELRIAILHGVDLSYFLKKKGLTSEELREYRLLVQGGVPKEFLSLSLSSETLAGIRRLNEKIQVSDGETSNIDFISRYVPSKGRPTISENSLNLILKYALLVDVSSIDFNKVREINVEPILKGLKEGIEIDKLELVAYSKVNLTLDVTYFLLDLAYVGVDIEPYVKGQWSKSQILEVVKCESVITSTELVMSYVSELFSTNQIYEVIRAIKYNKSFAANVAQVDAQGYPIYNEYQMHEIVEGLRFNLDINKYADSTLSDFEMRERRERLINEKEEKGYSIRSKLRINKAEKGISINGK